MSAINVQTRSGNRVQLSLNGTIVGLAQSARFADDYAPEPASGIGDIHVTEWVPTQARHTVNLSMMVLQKKALYDLGLIPENGDDALLGIVFDIETFSKDDGKLLRKYRGCSYASGELDITKHAILMQTGLFNCLDAGGPIPNTFPAQ